MSTSPLQIILATLTLVWLFSTALYQFDRFAGGFVAWDWLRLLPRWTFFGPRPGVHDYHLVFRSGSGSSELGQWNPVRFYRSRPPYGFAWNPAKRRKKIVNDLYQMLVTLQNKKLVTPETVPFTVPYLMLLNASRKEVVSIEATTRYMQFAVLKSTGHSDREVDLGYLSHVHEI